MTDQPFKPEDVIWRWKPTEEQEDGARHTLAAEYAFVWVDADHHEVNLYIRGDIGEWMFFKRCGYPIAELLRQLLAERKRCREEEVGPLIKALYDLRAWAISEVGNNDVPQEAVDAIVAINAVERIQKELIWPTSHSKKRT